MKILGVSVVTGLSAIYFFFGPKFFGGPNTVKRLFVAGSIPLGVLYFTSLVLLVLLEILEFNEDWHATTKKKKGY